MKMTDEDEFNAYMEEQKARTLLTQPIPQGQQRQPMGQPGQPPVLSTEEQIALNSVQSQTAPAVNEIKASQGECPQCGMFHPPTGGKPCPNAGVATSTVAIDDGKVNTYLVQWKNIILTHIQKLNIEGWEKEFQNATMMFAEKFDGVKKDV